jgi:hypothetical protein
MRDEDAQRMVNAQHHSVRPRSGTTAAGSRQGYRVRAQCLRQIGDVVVVSEFKELYPPSSIFSSSLAELPDKSDGDREAESSAQDYRRKPHGNGGIH